MFQNIDFNVDLTPFSTIQSQQKTKKKRGESSGGDIHFYRKHIKNKIPITHRVTGIYYRN